MRKSFDEYLAAASAMRQAGASVDAVLTALLEDGAVTWDLVRVVKQTESLGWPEAAELLHGSGLVSDAYGLSWGLDDLDAADPFYLLFFGPEGEYLESSDLVVSLPPEPHAGTSSIRWYEPARDPWFGRSSEPGAPPRSSTAARTAVGPLSRLCMPSLEAPEGSPCSVPRPDFL